MGLGVALDTPVRFVRGVGPVRAEAFAGLGVHTVSDLIEYFPFRHEMRPQSQPLGSLCAGAVVTIVGALSRVQVRGPFSRRYLSAIVEDGTGRCRVRWFNAPYLFEKLHDGQIVRLSGKVGVSGQFASLTNPKLTPVEDAGDALARDHDEFDPVYPATAQLPSKLIARAVACVLAGAAEGVIDHLPDPIRRRRNLPPRRTAVVRYHQPTSPNDVQIARSRLAYDELLLCRIAVSLSRIQRAAGPKAPQIKTTPTIDRRIRRRFPFELTDGQDRAVGEILADLARAVPMNRMLQADVGAGKTAVAIYAALVAIANRRQVAMLAPTEVLATQHLAKIEKYLEGSRVRVAYLAGSTPKARRHVLLGELSDGVIDLLVGTHAMLEPEVRFASLGLVVVDEQHKFGVAQRAALRRKGEASHSLVLTATPIPRTLAMTVFGDLDVSTIKGLPPYRKRVATHVVRGRDVQDAWAFVRKALDRGEQAFVVYPLVEESEALPLKAAAAERQRLSESTLRGYDLGLLHGRMNASEKAKVMDRFRAGRTQVLVTTTVVEVGVDVPDATIMVIQHAERYGLSQLHQLRGRIGRGTKSSFALLLVDSPKEESLARLNILCQTNDGFRVAEEDLRLRGPGALLGTRQHGLPQFKVADLATDLPLLEDARTDAADILRTDRELSKPEHAALKCAVLKRYSRLLGLMDVG